MDSPATPVFPGGVPRRAGSRFRVFDFRFRFRLRFSTPVFDSGFRFRSSTTPSRGLPRASRHAPGGPESGVRKLLFDMPKLTLFRGLFFLRFLSGFWLEFRRQFSYFFILFSLLDFLSFSLFLAGFRHAFWLPSSSIFMLSLQRRASFAISALSLFFLFFGSKMAPKCTQIGTPETVNLQQILLKSC